MADDKPDPGIPEDERHPGAPPRKETRPIGEDRKAGEEKPKQPVGNSALPDEPAAFPPHDERTSAAGARIAPRRRASGGRAGLGWRPPMRSSLLVPLLPCLLAAAPSAPRSLTESAFWQCWQRDVVAPCSDKKEYADEAAVDACKTERAKATCTAERDAYEKELAAGMAADAIDLLAASMKRVCLLETASRTDGKVQKEEEDAIVRGWREALDVRSDFMKACERSGHGARECDEKATDAERKTRGEFCPTGR